MADSATVKTSWADDVEVEELEPPKVEDYVDENGIRVTVEYTVNDEGKKVKVWSCLDRGEWPVRLIPRYTTQDYEEDQAYAPEIARRSRRGREETMDKVRERERYHIDTVFRLANTG